MNYFEVIESIKKKLITNGNIDIADEILERQLSGGTGGEVLISVCSKLLGVKKSNKIAYNLIEEEAAALIKYANSIGLYPKAT